MALISVVGADTLAQENIAQENKTPIIGLVVPLSGTFEKIGQNIQKGFLKGVEDEKNKGNVVEIQIEDDKCEAETARQKAREMEKVDVIVGPVCFDVAKALMEEMKEKIGKKNVPLITLDTRNELLERMRQYHNLPLFALSPNPMDEAKAMIKLGIPYFEGKPFAMLDDGSIHGRDLSDAMQLLGQEKGVRPIVIADMQPLQSNYRTLLGQMKRAGAQALMIAAQSQDVEVLIGNMKELEIKWPVVLGEQAGVMAHNGNELEIENVMLIGSDLKKTKKGKTIEAFLLPENRTKAFFEGYALLEIAVEIAKREHDQQFKQPFDTILGEIIFVNGRANHRPFRAKVWDGNKFTAQTEH